MGNVDAPRPLRPEKEVQCIMALYEYRCDQHGISVAAHPMGEAPVAIPCTVCSAPALRSFSAPRLASSRRDIVATIDRCEQTRDEPALVTSLPLRHPSRRTPVAAWNPALARLPRP